MASSQRVSVVQGDNLIKIVFNIKKDNRVENILGATIILEFKNTKTGRIMTRECLITDANMAECTYVLTSEDTAEAGGYVTELTITYSNGTKLVYQSPIVLIVTPQLI